MSLIRRARFPAHSTLFFFAIRLTAKKFKSAWTFLGNCIAIAGFWLKTSLSRAIRHISKSFPHLFSRTGQRFTPENHTGLRPNKFRWLKNLKKRFRKALF